jgi:acyl-CoA reductase-like NAD-dependent aldehyde dehydrogenase
MSELFQSTGANLVAGEESADGKALTASISPRTGIPTHGPFHEATPEEVARACGAAADTFEATRSFNAQQLSWLLETIAAALESHADAIIQMAESETGLSPGWLARELVRTFFQARAFASLLNNGRYVEATIDTPDPSYPPAPLPDLRRMLVPVGPVAVFEASNLPLAFGVAGGDTVAALAAGCPVIVKAHPAHPATSEIVGRLVAGAVADVRAPAGMFSLLHGDGADVATRLITAPEVRAAAFTGSRRAGRVLSDLAAARPDPITVYAEMGSVNPVFITESALRARGQRVAVDLVASMLFNNGQLCTKPGLVLVPAGATADSFISSVAASVGATGGGVMLNRRLRDALAAQVASLEERQDVTVVLRAEADEGEGVRAPATVLRTTAQALLADPKLAEEHFGPACVIATCASEEEMLAVARQLEGQLTATIHAEADDDVMIKALAAAVREHAGRLIWNGFPTGVAVSHAMHHGGPYPATSAPAHSSVGTSSIGRFMRPVVFQDFPDSQLPPALQDANPLGILRLVNGSWTDAPITRQNAADA